MRKCGRFIGSDKSLISNYQFEVWKGSLRCYIIKEIPAMTDLLLQHCASSGPLTNYTNNQPCQKKLSAFSLWQLAVHDKEELVACICLVETFCHWYRPLFLVRPDHQRQGTEKPFVLCWKITPLLNAIFNDSLSERMEKWPGSYQSLICRTFSRVLYRTFINTCRDFKQGIFFLFFLILLENDSKIELANVKGVKWIDHGTQVNYPDYFVQKGS